MSTNTDTQFAARFADMTASAFVAGGSTPAGFVPTTSPVNAGMVSDIGRAIIYGPDTQDSFYARFMRSPLSRGDANMVATFGEVNSHAYSPTAADSTLFDGSHPAMVGDVQKVNLSRQIRVEIHNDFLKRFCQTDEMIGDTAAAIAAASNACYLDDMWVSGKEYFSGSVRGAQTANQCHVMTNGPSSDGFADEMNELIWSISQNQFGYKSTKYNASQRNGKSTRVNIALKKSCEYPAFKKLYSETFHPDFLKVAQTIDYVDDFATCAGAPSDAGELLGMIVDDRAFNITPLSDGLETTSFYNNSRRSVTYFTTYNYIFQHSPQFNVAWIFAPKA